MKKLGQILIEQNIITQDQLEKALRAQKESGGTLGDLVIKLGFASESQIAESLSRQLGIPYASVSSGNLKPAADQELEKIVPHEFAIKNSVLPLSRNLNSLTVALSDPLDLILVDNLKKMSGCEINPVISNQRELLQAIETFYGEGKMLNRAIEASYDISVEGYQEEKTQQLSLDKLILRAEEAPVVKLVDLVVREAIRERASDIHIEPQRDRISLRYRIDGVLYEMPPPARQMLMPIISRIKILSKMDIAERRLPQDGGFSVAIDDKLIDLRVSSIPTIYGEKVVLRILDKSRVPLDLSQLGFNNEEIKLIRKGIQVPYGLIFLTGPTGSGKSTTLYALLNELKSPTVNILTVEDPVEYKLDGINQVQVRPDIGLTFASTLRSFLRQDPDIMLVGEVRDMETAEICVRASLTGHLVFSTLHTNDAASCVIRLVDIGLPEYLVAVSLRLIVAQRLVRKLCSHCKEAVEITRDTLPKGIKLNTNIMYIAKGCEKCKYIGFSGRMVVSEIIIVDEDVKEAIFRKKTAQEITHLIKEKGMSTLLESGLRRVEEGTTSLEEVFSVTY